MRYQFVPAGSDEETVYGASRPGYLTGDTSDDAVADWITYMQTNGMDRVCCLLDGAEREYTDLLGDYADAFGTENVCHSPIPDYDTVSGDALIHEILPFLNATDAAGERVVVHCSAGKGRTGHVLALWLATQRGYSLHEAIETVRTKKRRPLEAASKTELERLLKISKQD